MRIFVYTFIIFCLATPTISSAQLQLPSETAQIITTPRFPEGNTEVIVKLEAYTFDTTGATIAWTIDGVSEPDFINKSQITLQTGDIGTKQTVTAFLRLRNGQVIETTKVITPSRIDIILEANTMTPLFYEGRPLPSIGSDVRAIAIPNTTSNLSPSSYSYNWFLNSKPIGNSSITGSNIIKFIMPLGKEATLSVDVIDRNSIVVANRAIKVVAADPEVIFYPDNSLRGLSSISTGVNYRLIGDEMSFRAETYFMNKDILDLSPLIEWKIDNKIIKNPNTDKQTITLQNAGGGGTFKILFHIRNLKQLLQGAKGNFNIIF